MEGHCSCCDGNRQIIEAFKAQVASLNDKIKNLEDKNDSINDDLNEAQNSAELAEKERDDAENAKDATAKALLEEKQKHLEALRGLEFSLNSLCPCCLGLLEHKTGCNMKLGIFRLCMELNRSAILRLGRIW